MSRYTADISDRIHIAYGYDEPLRGYFLSVYDRKYEWGPNKTEEENTVSSEVDPSGEGEIDSYATNDYLISRNVVNANGFFIALAKYQDHVPDEHFSSILCQVPF